MEMTVFILYLFTDQFIRLLSFTPVQPSLSVKGGIL